jgi:adenosylcobinamide-GDP ribazoletransferase
LPEFLKPFFAALGFLTIVPAPGGWRGDEKTLARSLPWFSLVGLLIGLFAATADRLLCISLPALPASVVTVSLLIAASGGLHLDGLADTADGFFSSRPRERILEIMKDSRIGSMGVAAVVALFLLKVAVLEPLTGDLRYKAILLMPIAGRFAPVFMMVTMKYVRNDGLGTAFGDRRSPVLLIFSFVFLAAAGAVIEKWTGLTATGAAVAVVAVFSLWCRKKIGGYTGDTLGAAVELAEAIPPLFFLVSLNLKGVL